MRYSKGLESLFLTSSYCATNICYTLWHLCRPLFKWKWALQHLLSVPLSYPEAWCCPALWLSCMIYSARMGTLRDQRWRLVLLWTLDINTDSTLLLMRSQYLLNECMNHNLIVCLLLTSKNPSSIASLLQNTPGLTAPQGQCSLWCPLHYLTWKVCFVMGINLIVKP